MDFSVCIQRSPRIKHLKNKEYNNHLINNGRLKQVIIFSDIAKNGRHTVMFVLLPSFNDSSKYNPTQVQLPIDLCDFDTFIVN